MKVNMWAIIYQKEICCIWYRGMRAEIYFTKKEAEENKKELIKDHEEWKGKLSVSKIKIIWQ